MPDNQFSVAVPNVLQALMQGEQGYKDVRGMVKENTISAVREQAAQDVMQGGDPKNALARLLSVGDDKGAATLATVIHNQQQGEFQNKSLAETSRMNTAQIGNMEQQRSFQGQQLAETSRHNQAEEAKPVVGGYGSTLYSRDGRVLAAPSADGLLDDSTMTAMAKQYQAGDTSVMANLGRGAQGAQNIVRLRQKIAELNSSNGEGGAEQAQRNAEYFGTKAAARTVGVKGANIDLAATEFNQVLPIVQKASEAVNRTNYPDLNKIIQAYNEKTGDPNIVAFGGGVNTLVNIYARAISPQGVGTVSDKEHAREILQKAWSQGQFNAAVSMMKQEIDAALNSPEKVREQQRHRFLSGQPGASSSNLTGPGKTITGIDVTNLPPPPSQPGTTSTGVRWKVVE